MIALRNVVPTDEQLKLVSRNRQGIEVIKGAAGSGKTTTALLRLRTLITMALSRKKRLNLEGPVRILALTYNRTLRGYIDALAQEQIATLQNVSLEITTFGKWSTSALNNPKLVGLEDFSSQILGRSTGIKLSPKFLSNEVEYLMGRFLPEDLNSYAGARRDSRGTSPRVERPMREQLLSDVIFPYNAWKKSNDLYDWNDLAVILSKNKLVRPYDIIIVDEAQDFSANQVRAIYNNLADDYCLTFVTDTAQRIYARGFAWQECGLTINHSVRLSTNYRNTIEIARFAAPLIAGIKVDDDGTMPDFSTCRTHGSLPVIIKGYFGQQTRYVVNYIREKVDLQKETVVILHTLGGGYFSHIKTAFNNNNFNFVDITRQEEWPSGDENIAFSTMNSVKGLEFDHVIIVGLNEDMTSHGPGDDDDSLVTLRRLLAMSIGRARKHVILGYKQAEASILTTYFEAGTFTEVTL